MQNFVTLCDCPSIFQNHHDKLISSPPLIINNSCFLLVSEASDASRTHLPANRLLTFRQCISSSLRETGFDILVAKFKITPLQISQSQVTVAGRRRQTGSVPSFARGPRDKLVFLLVRVPPVPKKILTPPSALCPGWFAQLKICHNTAVKHSSKCA